MGQYRLPTDTYPIRYDVELFTHIHLEDEIERFKFQGVARIQLKARSFGANSITLHQCQLAIDSASIDSQNLTWDYNKNNEFLTFKLGSELSPSEIYTLEIRYHGTLREDLTGFYRSSYYDERGNQKYLAVTQFEEVHARHAFPCYDEPEIKAVFGITVVHGSGYFVVSNSPLLKAELEGGHTKTTLKDTPVMSTYLLAWVVCDSTDFAFIDVRSDIPQRIYGRRVLLDAGMADFSGQIIEKAMNLMDEHVGLKYTDYASKLDHFAVPELDSTAMENWGLTLFEEACLYSTERDHWLVRFQQAKTIAHECAHQYMGNLVTPEWWTWYWLNEGFANYYGTFLVGLMHPEFHAEEFFQLNEMQKVMETDVLRNTQAMTRNIMRSKVEKLTGEIYYQKAGSVIRMLMHALGMSTWQKGLKYYLTENAFKGVQSDDLSHGLQRAVDEDHVDLSGLSMKQIIDSWSLTPGFPVLHVSVDGNKLLFKQKRFSKPIKQNPKWCIPVSVITAEYQTKFWIQNYEHEQEFPTKTDWIIVNPKQTGYYRVNYDQELWNRIINKLNEEHEEVHHATRTGLLNDVFHLAGAGIVPYTTALRLAEYLKHETHFAPWLTMRLEFAYIDRILDEIPSREDFHVYMRELIHGIYESNNEEIRDIALRWASRTNFSSCRETLKRDVLQALEDPLGEFAVNLPDIIYLEGLRYASNEVFMKAWEVQQNSPQLRTVLLLSLASNDRPENQLILLQATLNGTAFTAREVMSVYNYVLGSNRNGLYTMIEFLKENAKFVNGKYGGVGSMVDKMYRYIHNERLEDRYVELLTVLMGEKIVNKKCASNLLCKAEYVRKKSQKHAEDVKEYLRNKPILS